MSYKLGTYKILLINQVDWLDNSFIFVIRCEKLCDLIWITRSQIKEADRFRVNLGRYFELPQSCEIINTLLDMTTQYLSSLVARYNNFYSLIVILNV